MKSSSQNGDHAWRFVTNHGHVLACVFDQPEARLRDVAEAVGITERAVATIVEQLEAAGYLTRTRTGRRNRYEVHVERPLRHPRHSHRTVGELIDFLALPE
jgi:DNA-binding MarR family transcriptional regulator